MANHEHSVELAGVNLAGRNHVCAFFNTIDEEHRVLGSFYKDGIDRGEKAAHIVELPLLTAKSLRGFSAPRSISPSKNC
jgi:hypothetical protein